jgi:cation diffusion facilitator CzcD-associated flavoprotein CzcO
MAGASGSGRRHITIVGAGPGGICAGIRLKQAGFDDFVMLERSTRVGGTWANARYPGLCCDTPSLLYSFTFEQKLDWTRTCARQPEIRRYMEDLVDKYGLAAHIRFGSELREARWDEDEARWILRTTDGWTTSSNVLISGLGMFNQLRWPDIPGLEDFGGQVIHTGSWPEGGVDFRGNRVIVIGCAGSAIQAVPEIANVAESLVVYLRTANWIVPKEDDRYTDEQLDEFRANPAVALAKRAEYFEWAESVLTFDKPELMRELEESAFENLSVVEDLETRELLRPRVPLGSQRILFSNDFYPTFNRDNVELVGEQIEAITTDGVVTVDGRERTADVLVLATGYDTTRFVSVIDLVGRGGLRIEDEWRDGARAYLGITVSGFPNLFMLYGPNTNQGSILLMLEHEVAYVVRKLEHMRDHGIAWLDVSREAMDDYNEALQRHLDSVEVLRTFGTKYYRAGFSPTGRIVTQWPYTMAEYGARTSAPDEDAFEEHLAVELRPAPVAG